MELVYAQEARRALDRLVGYLVSPVLSDKAGQALSAGRVQSVALRLIVDRERAISSFTPTTHYSATLKFEGWSVFWNRAPHISESDPYVLDRGLAERAAAARDCTVLAYTAYTAKRSPPSPLSTSLLLQEASNKLNFPPEKITALAQRLFEAGHVTYIRTDSVNISDEAAAEIKAYAITQGLPVSEKLRKWKSKEGAQEAHEAIRPTHVEQKDLGDNDDEKALYRLIWMRAVASQLADALYDVKEAHLQADECQFSAKGQSLKFAGWKGLGIEEDPADEGSEGEADQAGIPALEVGQALSASSGEVVELVTRAPARYTVASLTTKLENEGIGRPATYAAIMQNILQRGYVFMKGKAFMPSPVGEFVVDQLVTAQFGFMDLAFTRSMEDSLDEIAQGRANYLSVVKPAHEALQAEIENVKANALLKPLFPCPECKEAGLRRFKRKDGSAFFWKCQGEDCGTFFDDKNGEPIERKFYQCPRCESELRRWQRKDKEGYFWFCTNNDCKTLLNDERNKPQKAVECPSCEKLLTRRKGEHGFWWGCTGFKDGCKTTAKDKKGKPDFAPAANGPTPKVLRLKIPGLKI